MKEVTLPVLEFFIPQNVVKRLSSNPSFGEEKKDLFSVVFFTAIMHPKGVT